MPKIQVAIPPGGGDNLTGWTASAILSLFTDYVNIRWDYPPDDDADVVIFIATSEVASNFNPIIAAVRSGLTVFVVTDDEKTVSQDHLIGLKEGKIFFFHARKFTSEGGFLPFEKLRDALRRILRGLPLTDLGKE